MMLLILLQTLWYFLPALVANMAPVLASFWNWLPVLAIPLDGRYIWRGQRLLGDHKTIRGLVVGIVFGSVTALFQYFLELNSALASLTLNPFESALTALSWGALLGFAALVGDALKSFVKRQLHIEPGEPWIPWDQLDVVLGVILITQWWHPLPLLHVGIALIGGGVLMYVVSVVGVRLHIKQHV